MRLLFTILSLTVIIDTSGQVNGYDYDRKDLKAFKKIVVTSDLNTKDKFASKLIYSINPIGDIAKYESYDSGKLTSWTKYEYYEDGRIKYEENHHKVFSYDERLKKHIGKVRDDVYSGKSFTYKDNDLVEVSYVDGYEGSKTYSNLDIFEYDSMGRLIKEVSINSFVGLTGKFKSNSTVLDSLYYKGEATKSITTYQYLQDSIVAVIYNDENMIRGYKLTKLNSDKKPILIVDTDPQGNKIKSISITYDNKKRLIEQRTKIIDIDKIDYDLLAGDSYQIIYNDKGLPIIELTKDKGKLISKWALRYE